MISAGGAKERAQDKARVKCDETFGPWAERRMRDYQTADSMRDMRKIVDDRELRPVPVPIDILLVLL